eukprot:6487798-Amphidinium_carterae.1
MSRIVIICVLLNVLLLSLQILFGSFPCSFSGRVLSSHWSKVSHEIAIVAQIRRSISHENSTHKGIQYEYGNYFPVSHVHGTNDGITMPSYEERELKVRSRQPRGKVFIVHRCIWVAFSMLAYSRSHTVLFCTSEGDDDGDPDLRWNKLIIGEVIDESAEQNCSSGISLNSEVFIMIFLG